MNIRFTLRDALAAAVDSFCIIAAFVAAIIVMVPAAALLVGLLAWVLCNDQVVP